MSYGEDPNIDHGFAESRLDHTVTHAHDEEEEKGKGVASGIQNCRGYHEYFVDSIVSVAILVVCPVSAFEEWKVRLEMPIP